MKKWICLIMTLAMVLMLSACAQSGKEENVSGAEETQVAGYQIVDAKTAVVLSDAKLTDIYTLIYEVDEQGQYQSQNPVYDPETEKTLAAGDIVRILQQVDEKCVVEVLKDYSIPFVRGTVDAAVLSTDPAQIALGNMGILRAETSYYDSVNGTVLGQTGPSDSVVEILERSEQWCRFRASTGGEDLEGWIPEDSVSYDFDTETIIPES